MVGERGRVGIAVGLVSRARDRLAGGVAAGLSILLFAAPLAFGAVHRWASALLEIGVWALALVWLLRGTRQAACGSFIVSAVALSLYIALQSVPLPREAISVVSPASAEIYRQTVDAVPAADASPLELRPVGKVEDEKAPLAARQRILEASLSKGWPSHDWRSLAPNPFETRSDLLLYLAYGLAVWLAATLPLPALLLRSAVLSGFWVAALALIEQVTWNGHLLWFFVPYDWRAARDSPRMLGPFVNPDHMAAFLAMTVAPAAALIALHGRRLRGNDPQRSGRDILAATALAIGLAIVVAALVGSASRGGIVGAMLGAAAFWGGSRRGALEVGSPRSLRKRRNRAERLRRWGSRIAPVVVMLAIMVGGFTYAGPRARSTLDLRLGEAVSTPALDFRIQMWRQSLPMVADFPIAGLGAGSWREVFRRYERYPIVGYRPNHLHNDYLEWLIEVGFAGAALTVALGWTYVRWARGNEAIPAVARWGILGAVAAIAWHEFFDFALRVPACALLLSVLLGLLCNPHWKGVGSRFFPSHGLTKAKTTPDPFFAAAAVMAAIALTIASLGQLREFLQWARARGGSPLLDGSPKDAETWHALGVTLFRAGLRYEAPTGQCFRKAIELRPTSEKSFWRMYLTDTTYAGKRAALEAALFLDPTRAAWRLIYARLLDKLGRGGEALAALEEAAYRDPELAHHPYLVAGEGEPPEVILETVERGFRRALDDRPDDPRLLSEVASFYERFGIWGEAASLWIRAAEENGDWARYGLQAGASYARATNYERAEETTRRAIGDDPERPDGYRLLALSVLRPQKRYAEAEKTLELGIRRSRNRAPLYSALYDVRMEQGDRQRALEALAQAADARPRDGELRFSLGAAYLGAGDYHRARMAFDRAIALDETRAQFHYYRGLACEKLYDLAGAREAYARATELEPQNEGYRNSLAHIRQTLAENGSRS